VERVVGIGGVFLRPRDAPALRAWYRDHLGVELESWGGFAFHGKEGDTTVWAIFDAETDYFPAEQRAMVNYRVRDLEAMLAQLREAGVAVEGPVADEANGLFAWGVDPEGNRFELWQPLTS
jgi:predicted enzyme related to lactoylglutathione lyase